MALLKEDKEKIIDKYKTNKDDTGSIEVQVAILTEEIKRLTNHLKANKKDTNSKRGLQKKVSQRKKLLSYLARKDVNRYRELIKNLGLRK